jgi:prophage regulatory protein
MSRYDTMEIGHMRSLKEQLAPYVPSKERRELHLLSFPELRSKKGICYSREHVRRLVHARRFPRPIKLGDARNGRVAWSEQEVDDWLAARFAERDAA